MFRVYPYKLGSRSARRLAEGLGNRLLLKPNGTYRNRRGDTIVNWGNSEVPQFFDRSRDNFLNKPENIALASHKLRTFEALEEAGIPTVPFTTSAREAGNWDGKVMARTRLQGHSGEGIIVVGQDDEIPQAPLYTKFVQNGGEYRVHVMNGEVIDYRKKSRQHDDEATEDESDIRTLENGWVYRQGSLRRLDRVEQLAIDTIETLGLDFGAVDIIQDSRATRPEDMMVLEVNTAVGLADNTLESYIEAFRRIYATD
jgi:glutathione synthase/RimK-type ligase-like ATP-grasp enzyme